MIEIGTGLGILTRALAARGAKVTTIEVDAGLVRALREEALLPAEVNLIHADALQVDFDALLDRLDRPARVVANLPYSISAPVLRRLLDLRKRLVDWSVMLQRDVAVRLLATPGTRDYGSLTVLHALCVRTERVQELRPGCFFPVPRVRSTFLRITPRPSGPSGDELCRVERVVRAAFGTRRKTLANALREGGLARAVPDALEAAGIDPRARAEALEPERFLALSRAVGG